MMNHSYRILSLIMIIAMLLGLVPAYAWESFENTMEFKGEEAEGSADSLFCVLQ